MASPRLSASPKLRLIASAFATISIGFGINAILSPASGLSFFELAAPAAGTAERSVVDALMVVYGARDIFMGLAVYAVAAFGDRRALACLLVATSAVAFVDGAVCRAYAGRGEWSHWGYAPALTVVGALLFGALDGVLA